MRLQFQHVAKIQCGMRRHWNSHLTRVNRKTLPAGMQLDWIQAVKNHHRMSGQISNAVYKPFQYDARLFHSRRWQRCSSKPSRIGSGCWEKTKRHVSVICVPLWGIEDGHLTPIVPLEKVATYQVIAFEPFCFFFPFWRNGNPPNETARSVWILSLVECGSVASSSSSSKISHARPSWMLVRYRQGATTVADEDDDYEGSSLKWSIRGKLMEILC